MENLGMGVSHPRLYFAVCFDVKYVLLCTTPREGTDSGFAVVVEGMFRAYCVLCRRADLPAFSSVRSESRLHDPALADYLLLCRPALSVSGKPKYDMYKQKLFLSFLPLEINPPVPNAVNYIDTQQVQSFFYTNRPSLLVGRRLGPCISTPARRSRNIDRLLPRASVALSVFESAYAPSRGCKHRRRRETHANQSPRCALEAAPGHARRNLR